MLKSLALFIGFIVVSAASAFADKLPKDAVKLDPSELRSLYAGKSSNWSKSRAYFAPDGTYYLARKDKSLYAEGRWTVNGNKICANLSWVDVKTKKSGRHTDCWTWYKAGKTYWTLWSGDKDKKNGYYDGELKKLSNGDKVSKSVATLKKS